MEVHFVQGNGIETKITLMRGEVEKHYSGKGNGRLDAVSNAIMKHFDINFKLVSYEEHALQMGSDSTAVAYVGIEDTNGKVTWGVGTDDDIINASVRALISAVNRAGVK